MIMYRITFFIFTIFLLIVLHRTITHFIAAVINH